MTQKAIVDKIIIGGQEVEIKKLKAGKFYQLQKKFAEMLQTTGMMGSDDSASDKFVNMMGNFPEKTAEIVAYCADMDVETLLDTAEPEEIPLAFEKCMKLNNVFDNLKKYVAPMEKMVKNIEG